MISQRKVTFLKFGNYWFANDCFINKFYRKNKNHILKSYSGRLFKFV